MKLLVVVDHFADPPVIGTTVIAYHWARLLRRRGHAVELLCARDAWDPRWEGYYRDAGIGRPDVAVARRGRVRRALAPLRLLPPSLLHVDADRLARDLAPAAYDAAVVIGPALLPLAERLERSCAVLFVPTDAVSLVLGSRTAAWSAVLDRLRWRLEARLWRRIEARRFRRLGAVAFVAPADARAAARRWPEHDRKRLHVIPNGVDADFFRPDGTRPSVSEIVFTGNLWTYDSVAGATWFIDEILPRIAEAVPDTTFRLVGRNPDPALLDRARRDPRIVVNADVPDLRPYLSRAAVYACPLVSGGGVKNRLLEALAMGKAAVATASCAEALDLVPGRHLRAADAPAAFARATVELLRDPGLRDALGDAGRRIVVERFSWEAAVERVEEVLGAAEPPRDGDGDGDRDGDR